MGSHSARLSRISTCATRSTANHAANGQRPTTGLHVRSTAHTAATSSDESHANTPTPCQAMLPHRAFMAVMGRRFFWLCAWVTIGSAFTSAGFSVAALFSSGNGHVNAMYATSRSLSLAAASVVVVLAHSRSGLLAVAFIMALVQGADAVIGAMEREPLKTFGPAFLALVTVAVLILLSKCIPPIER